MRNKKYLAMLSYLHSHQQLKKSIVMITKISPILVFISYAFLLLSLYLQNSVFLLRTVLVPLITFFLVSILRIKINRPRPFEEFDFDPLVPHSKGSSFPSRHTASAFIITYAFFYSHHLFSLGIFIIALIVAFTRVLTGVHRISDVLFAIVLSSLLGYLGFYIF